MSRLFDDATNDRLYSGVLPANAYPVSFACWFKTDTDAADQELIGFGHGSLSRNLSLRLRDTPDSDVIAFVNNAAGYSFAGSSISFSKNVWQHAVAVFASSTVRYVFLNGGNIGFSSTSRTFPVGMNSTHIGARYRSGAYSLYMSGPIAEPAIWNTSLTAEDAAVLGSGYCPLFVKTANLVRYLPLKQVRGLYNPELIIGQEFYDYGSPSMADHPRIIYPSSPKVIATISTGPDMALLMQHYKKMRVA